MQMSHLSSEVKRSSQIGAARVRQFLKKFDMQARKGRFKEDRKRQRGVPCADDSLNSPDCIPPIPHM